jgi:hypothetical protein
MLSIERSGRNNHCGVLFSTYPKLLNKIFETP